MKCTLCKGKTADFFKKEDRKYLRCQNCKAVLLHPSHFLNATSEKERYLKHTNNVDDPGYQNFVGPLVSRVLQDFSNTARGLDYGCGTGPVACIELQKHSYKINLFDPYFENHPEVLEDTYDFIICSEVMEHFNKPFEEFKRLFGLLNPGGKLYCKTSIFYEFLDFKNWYYKNDPTHVFFYSEESLKWIREHFGFHNLEIASKLIVFEK